MKNPKGFNENALNRRKFLERTTLAASGWTIMSRKSVFGSTANSRIQVGLIGVGGRGTRVSESLLKTGKAQFVALADYFDFQLKDFGDKMGIEPSKRFSGLNAYKEVLNLSEIDAVMLMTPPYFRPAQFAAAVEAGKHVFAEKPIAVDAWGCRRFQETGQQAANRKLTVVAGLQTRYEEGRQKIAPLIHKNAIGKPIIGHSKRLGGDLWRRKRLDYFTERDFQIRNWLYYLWASGDFLVEMHVHNLDVFNWFTGLLPVSATGHGGREVRTDIGDIYDHIAVTYEYPEDFVLSHTGSQISSGYSGQESQIIGSQGSYDSGTGLQISKKQRVEHGDLGSATDRQMAAFVDSVKGDGPYLNNSDYVTTSTFTCILGREAAYRKERLRWDDLWNSDQRIEMPV